MSDGEVSFHGHTGEVGNAWTGLEGVGWYRYVVVGFRTGKYTHLCLPCSGISR